LSKSGGSCWPRAAACFWTWLTIVSTRDFGTGLPLTTATFCACAASDARPAAASTMLAAKTLFFMVETLLSGR
jgi:hypothetical protein